jgi:hypothetical protein
MNTFDVHALAYVMHEISQVETGYLFLKSTGHASGKPDGDLLKKALKALDFADNFFSIYGKVLNVHKDSETSVG